VQQLQLEAIAFFFRIGIVQRRIYFKVVVKVIQIITLRLLCTQSIHAAKNGKCQTYLLLESGKVNSCRTRL
jgi:hypothetical protein